MSIGKKLKEAREKKGLSLKDIQEKTKIRVKYLKAIEDEEFEIIPGKVYVKVFIKGYAEQVGLDGSELVNEYKQIKDEEEKLKMELELEKEKENIQDKSFFQNKLLNIIILLTILLVVGFVIFSVFLLNDSKSLEKVPADDISVQELKKEESPVFNEEETKDKPNINNKIEGNILHTLEVVAVERSWVQIFVDGKEVFTGILEKGANKKIDGKNKVDLKIGNAAGIVVKKGDDTLGPWGKRGEVIQKSITLN